MYIAILFLRVGSAGSRVTGVVDGVGQRAVINGSHCQHKYKILLVDQAPGNIELDSS